MSALLRIKAAVGRCCPLIWQQYLCPRLCFLSAPTIGPPPLLFLLPVFFLLLLLLLVLLLLCLFLLAATTAATILSHPVTAQPHSRRSASLSEGQTLPLLLLPLPVLSSSSSVSCSSCSYFFLYYLVVVIAHCCACCWETLSAFPSGNQWNRKWNIIHLRLPASFTPTCTSCPVLWRLQAALFLWGRCSKL